MKFQSLFSGINKKNVTNLSSADLAKRAVKVKYWHIIYLSEEGIHIYAVCVLIPRKIDSHKKACHHIYIHISIVLKVMS